MTLAQAIRKAESDINYAIRRQCWLAGQDIEVAADCFYEMKDGKPVPYCLCPADVLADDWEVVEVDA